MAGSALDDTLSIDPSRADAELAGTGYRFVRAIARSEAGVVWEVVHVNLAVRHVMKLLAAHLTDDPRLLDRFRVEAQVMARLGHENLLRVTDFGWTAAGRPYLVSELLAGRTLADLLAERGVLPVGPALELMGQALEGLGEAHRAGLVHRDVTLVNLFLCDPNEQGERLLKVMDFGLAKVLAPAGQVPSFAPALSTAPGAAAVRRAAISPEQADGRTVDARTDLYGIGVALYELVAGRGPFVCSTEAELALAHARAAPPPPSAVAPQPIEPELDAMVLRALAKDPAERFASASEMAAVLDQYAERLARSRSAPLARALEPAAPDGGRAAGGGPMAAPEVLAPRSGGRAAARDPREPRAPSANAIFRPGALCGGDRYRIVDLVSCGGFAEIYAARDLRDDSPRAIKVLQARHQSNEQAMGQLLREARAGISLVHPNLVRIYDAGIDIASGALYVAMELLEGHTLRELLRVHRQLDPLVALQWAAELADAVHVLNELGIIHRDLKPENIFVGSDGVLKVLDLGNIRIERVGLKTTRGPVTGTALYMSPEHIRGEKVDRRADVYALALITYECLAGVHPLLVGASVMPSMMEVTSWQLLKEIEPVTKLVPELPSVLWRALEHGLRKERDERMPSAAELAIHLRAVQDAMATARGGRARVPMMTVAVVRSTAALPAARPVALTRPTSPAASAASTVQAVAPPLSLAPRAPVAALAAAPGPTPTAGAPGPVARARPRWPLPLLAVVAFTAALAVTFVLRRPVDAARREVGSAPSAPAASITLDPPASAAGGAPPSAPVTAATALPQAAEGAPGPGEAVASGGTQDAKPVRGGAPTATGAGSEAAPVPSRAGPSSAPTTAGPSASRGGPAAKPKPLFE